MSPSDLMLGKKQLLIGGEWRDAADGKTMPVVNPATEEVIAEVASAGAADVDAAVAAARAALAGPWGKMSARERGRLVWKLGERLMEQIDEVARLETLHNGKPIIESRHIEIPAAAECLQYFAGWADKIHGETMPVKGQALVYTLREPLGVVAAIVPWNFPLLLAVWKVAPALATGNTVILKPASQTPLTALALGAARDRRRASRPACSTSSPAAARPSARRSSSIPASTRSRSPATRARAAGIMRSAADTLKHLTLELGGKSPNIVFPDADLDAAVRGATIGIFYGKGEVCAAGSRLLVDKSIKDAVPREGGRADEEDGRRRSARSEDAARRDLVEEPARARAEVRRAGARRRARRSLAGGSRTDIGTGKGYFMQPTVFGDVHAGHDDRARGDLRAGARGDRLRGRR